MSIDYIAHPVRGNVRSNLLRILRICRQLHFEEGVTPFTPYLGPLLYLEERDARERARGIAMDHEIIRPVPSRIQVFGELTQGVRGEIDLYRSLGRRIILRAPEHERELRKLLGRYEFETRPFALLPEYASWEPPLLAAPRRREG